MCLISVEMDWTLLFVIPRGGEGGCPIMGHCLFLVQLPWSQRAWSWEFPQSGTHMAPGPTLSLVSNVSQRKIHVVHADTLRGHCCNSMTPFWAIAEGEPWHLPLPVSLVFIIKMNTESVRFRHTKCQLVRPCMPIYHRIMNVPTDFRLK